MAQGTHKIPQNVTSYQGRIIGKFTAKQFIYLAIGIIIAFLVFNTPLPALPKYLLIGVTLIITLIFSLANVQGRTTDEWISYFMQATNGATQMIWRKEEYPPSFLLPDSSFTKERKANDRLGGKYELDRFIQMWNPTNPTEEYTKEEMEILARVKEHGGLGTAPGASPATSIPNQPTQKT